MTTNDPGWPPSNSAGSGDHASPDGWGSAASSLPDDVDNPWSAASGDVGLGGTAASAPSANPAPVGDPAGAPAFPAYEPTSDPPPTQYGGPPTPYGDAPTQYGGPPTTPYPTTPYPASSTPYGYPSAAQPPNPYPPTAYPPDPYPANPYGSQGYGPTYPSSAAVNPYTQNYQGYVPQSHPRAAIALVLGILGMIPCLSLASIPAIILGRQVLTQSQQEPGRWTGTGMARAAFVLGIIGLVFGVLYVLGAVSGSISDG